MYYKEERDNVIHEGTKDEAIDVFKKKKINKYKRIDPSPNIIYLGLTHPQILYC